VRYTIEMGSDDMMCIWFWHSGSIKVNVLTSFRGCSVGTSIDKGLLSMALYGLRWHDILTKSNIC
jgi:hypothetical protein